MFLKIRYLSLIYISCLCYNFELNIIISWNLILTLNVDATMMTLNQGPWLWFKRESVLNIYARWHYSHSTLVPPSVFPIYVLYTDISWLPSWGVQAHIYSPQLTWTLFDLIEKESDSLKGSKTVWKGNQGEACLSFYSLNSLCDSVCPLGMSQYCVCTGGGVGAADQ